MTKKFRALLWAAAVVTLLGGIGCWAWWQFGPAAKSAAPVYGAIFVQEPEVGHGSRA